MKLIFKKKLNQEPQIEDLSVTEHYNGTNIALTLYCCQVGLFKVNTNVCINIYIKKFSAYTYVCVYKFILKYPEFDKSECML